jgi:para-aminobenzoate synthetase/4-amino-4-deoxychorismate lyase
MPEFQLIETMLWDREFTYLSMHLDRIESSASYFEFSFDRAAIMSQLMERSHSFLVGDRYRVKLLLESTGTTTFIATPHLLDHSACHIRLSSEPTSSNDVFLRHKTTHRDRYDRLYAKARADGFDEVLFLNEKEEVTEGSISNVFILRKGKLLTPPLSSGVLPGIFRRHLLETDRSAEERVLKLQDLESADVVFLCNSLRGMRRVDSICLDASIRLEARIS